MMEAIERKARALLSYIEAVDKLQHSTHMRAVKLAIEQLGCDPYGIGVLIPADEPETNGDGPSKGAALMASTGSKEVANGHKRVGRPSKVTIEEAERAGINLDTHTVYGTPRKRARPRHKHRLVDIRENILRAVEEGFQTNREIANYTKLPERVVDNATKTLTDKGELDKSKGRSPNIVPGRMIPVCFFSIPIKKMVPGLRLTEGLAPVKVAV